jgi:hypothetical protein
MPKRRIIIREADFEKVKSKLKKDYQQVSFTPLTQGYFEKRVTYYALKGKGYLADQFAHYPWPANMLGRLTGFKLHDRRYPQWLVRYNSSGEMTIKAGLRQPESVLGYVTLVDKEKTK